jgi:hypothetical protein
MTDTNTQLGAMFIMDENGVPKYEKVGGHKHYFIKLFIDGAPKDAQKTTYTLHETYFDPIRDVSRDDGKFVEPITSYGDYIIKANVLTPDGRQVVNRSLSDALRSSYSHDNISPLTIETALKDIENN